MLLDVPDGKDPITYVWGQLVPQIGPAAAAFSAAVYAHTTLGLREFEASFGRLNRVFGLDAACVLPSHWAARH
jgi:hypothetical protein